LDSIFSTYTIEKQVTGGLNPHNLPSGYIRGFFLPQTTWYFITTGNFRIKDVCRNALEHYDGLMRLFSLETKRYIPRSISLSPGDFHDSLCVAGGAFEPPICGGSEG